MPFLYALNNDKRKTLEKFNVKIGFNSLPFDFSL